MKKLLIIALSFILSAAQAQQQKAENIVVVTLDGMRWQEVFTGADSLLSFDTNAVYNERYVQKLFWAPDIVNRRKKLMPFLWSTIASNGIILGNRQFQNFVNNANPYWFSYPGYNEIFTGYPDTAVNSNDKVHNNNTNVFEYLNQKQRFRNKTALFGSWDRFSYIFNEKRSGLFVNDGFRDVPQPLTEKQAIYNRLQHELPDLFHGGERLDAATYNMGIEYIKSKKPKLIFFGFGDTDEFAHAGMYDHYLDAAQKADAWIASLWKYLQQDPVYAGKTTLIITTDHGRGAAVKGEWKHHGQGTPNCNQIWMAAIGPSIPARGEVMKPGQLHQGQIAATIAWLLGETFTAEHPVMERIHFDKY